MSAVKGSAILLSTFLAFAALYGPQPLLPLLAAEFDVSPTTAATIVTWSLLPMCIAPVVVGVVLQRVPSGRVVMVATFGLAATGMGFALAPVFAAMQVVRLLQGAAIAALLPAVMTYIAAEASRLRLVMAYYVSASVLGGLAGRVLLGAALGMGLDWRAYFACLSLVTAACGVLTLTLGRGGERAARVVSRGALSSVLRTRPYAMLFGLIFGAFFVMTALLNFAPFRMAELSVGVSTVTIALLYGGFIAGGAVSLLSVRIVDWFGSERRAILTGLAVLALAIAVAPVPSLPAIGVSITLVAVGFFLVHAVLAGFVNGRAGSSAPAVNGLYVAIYYAGGTLGSYLPGFVYARVGWWAFVGVLVLVASAAGLLAHLGLHATPAAGPVQARP